MTNGLAYGLRSVFQKLNRVSLVQLCRSVYASKFIHRLHEKAGSTIAHHVHVVERTTCTAVIRCGLSLHLSLPDES